MNHQYCIRILSHNLASNQSLNVVAEKLLVAIKNIRDISQIDLLDQENNHQIRMNVVAKCDFDSLQRELQNLSSINKVDLILQHGRDRAFDPQLLIMDMDSTLIQTEAINEIAKIVGVADKVSAITESAMHGELDFSESLRARVSMFEGVSIELLTTVHCCLPLTGGAKYLLKKAQAAGCHTALASGGFTYFAKPIAEKLKFDTLSANQLEIVDGVLTGKILGDIVDGESKLQTLKRLQQQLGISKHQIIAIGDGANDLPMLKAAGTGIAFHAKPTVQMQAASILNHNDLHAVAWLLNW